MSTSTARKIQRFVVLVLGALTWGRTAVGQNGDIRFENVTETSGFRSVTGLGGHGIQIVDVDGDGWLDVYVTSIYNEQEDRPDLLFMNGRNAELRFSEEGVQRGVEDDGFSKGYSNETHAAIFADLDNDGDFDLFNARTWNGDDRLYRNDGTGHFVDLTESAGIDVTDFGTRGVAAGDFDGNGLLDILVSAWQYIQPIIYYNLGGMRFERERIHGADNRPFANQGVTVMDVNADGRADAAFSAFEYLQEDTVGPAAVLLGAIDKKLKDETVELGLYYPRTNRDYRGSNGFSFVDIDNDGDLDCFIAGYQGSVLFRNEDGRFKLIQQFEGVQYTGAFGDADDDGDLDLYITGEAGDAVGGLFVNDGTGQFTLVPGVFVGVGNDARAGVFADLNNDGKVELVIASKQGVNTVFLNRSSGSSSIQLSLVGPNGEAGALNARVRLSRAGQLQAFREVRGASGYCAQESPRLHFGVDAASTYDVEIQFPNGTVMTRTNLGAGIHVIDARSN